MTINETYKIETDEDENYIILEAFKKKDGTIDYKIKGYYPTLNRAYKGLLKREVLKSELKDLESVMKRIEEVEKYIDKHIK